MRTIRVKGRSITVACQKCNFCLQSRRLDWVFRLLEHAREQQTGHFLTFTYDNENVPLVQGKDGFTYMTLNNMDLIRIHKHIRQENTRALLRLKKRNGWTWKKYQAEKERWKISYYSVGEYGSRFKRPHYHSLIFNIHPAVIQKLSYRQIWNKGNLFAGSVTGASVGYVCAYLIDKDWIPQDSPIKKPFSIMSKGLGKSYLKQRYKWNKQKADHPDDYRYYVMLDGHKQRLPRYYKLKIFNEFERLTLSDKAWSESIALMDEELERLTRIYGSAQTAYEKYFENLQNRHELIRIKANKIKMHL